MTESSILDIEARFDFCWPPVECCLNLTDELVDAGATHR